MSTPSQPPAPPKGDAPYPTIDQKLCFALYSCSLAMLQSYKPLLAAIGLTYPQYLVMLVLWETDGISIKRLAERLGQDPGSVTPLVKRLEEAGFVIRQRDTQDERNLSVQLTQKGRALQAKAERVSTDIALACHLTASGADDLRSRLTELTTTLRLLT